MFQWPNLQYVSFLLIQNSKIPNNITKIRLQIAVCLIKKSYGIKTLCCLEVFNKQNNSRVHSVLIFHLIPKPICTWNKPVWIKGCLISKSFSTLVPYFQKWAHNLSSNYQSKMKQILGRWFRFKKELRSENTLWD